VRGRGEDGKAWFNQFLILMDISINHQVAKKLLEAADLLEQQVANPFRVNAYRRAAETISTLKSSVEDIIENEGLEGLLALPHIGEGIARAVYGMVTAGRWAMLDRLRGALEPEKLFMTVPGIGPKLAERIHDHRLNIQEG
jgi:DNA polymerase (family 10)